MRELIYYIAISLDGFIAHEDGSFGGFPWDEAFIAELGRRFPETIPTHLRAMLGVEGDNQVFDTVLMGRKTYEVGLKEGITSPYGTLKQYVFSRTLGTSPDEHVTLVADEAVEVVRALKAEAGHAIWLCGGAHLAATLLAEGLIDTLILKLNPVLFGTGIPLFDGSVPLTALDLTDSTAFPSGHMLLHYRVHPSNTA